MRKIRVARRALRIKREEVLRQKQLKRSTYKQSTILIWFALIDIIAIIILLYVHFNEKRPKTPVF